MRPLERHADDHVLARPRGHCRAARRELRARMALAALTTIALAAIATRMLVIGA